MSADDERHVVGACPLDCPDGCSWIVTIRDDVPVRMRGNPEHPFTDGGLCKKVYPWLDYAADPNRLLTPLRRVAPKGSAATPDDQAASFKPISWEEALGEIADRFQRIIDTTGPAAIWPFWGTGNMGYLQGASGPVGDRLWNHLGVSAHDLTICSPAAFTGLSYSMGTSSGMDPEDVAHAGVVLIWGANTLVSGQHWWPFVAQAQRNGATVIVIDPVRTRTAERADLHLAPRPGTDGALALGVCRALIDGGHVDAAYIAKHTLGFDEFAGSLDDFTLDHTATVCGLEPGEITAVVEAITRAAPLTVKFGHGAQRHAGGGQAARAVSCIPALLGSFTTRGGGMFYSTGARYELNVTKAGGRRPDARPRTLAMTNLIANLETLDPPVEALWIYGANPVVSNPDTTGVRRALARDDLFVVATELYLTASTDFADIVLPGSMAHEHFDLNDSFAHLYLNLNRPATTPPGDCLPQSEIFRRLARAMGVDDPTVYASDEALLDDLLDTPWFAAAGIDAERLHREGFVRLPNTQSPFLPFAERFPTPSGRFEFVSERGEAEGVGRLPHYLPATEAGSQTGKHVYDLIAAAGDLHVNSTFAGTKHTLGRADTPTLTVHPADAQRDDLHPGDTVEVANERGSFTTTLRVDSLARRGTAVTTKGSWLLAVNATTDERDADMGKGAVFHDNRVMVTTVET